MATDQPANWDEMSEAEQLAWLLAHAGGGGDGDGDGDGGGPSAPAVDPVVAQKMNMFQQGYVSLWGEPATEAYLKAATKKYNMAEFMLNERLKPAYVTTDSFRKELASRRDLLAKLQVA